MPESFLKQFGELSQRDFEEHPVWIGCHTADYDEPWYDDTDEETFRPRTGPLPADPSEGMLLVRALATLGDGSRLPGFLTPTSGDPNLGEMQPHVFAGAGMFGFWGGLMGVPNETRDEFHAAVGKDEARVFPARVAADPGLSTGVVEVVVEGWQPADRAGSAAHDVETWPSG